MLDTMTIGHALRRSRELAGISDRSAARSIGVSRSTLRSWEADRAVPDTEQLSLAAGLYGHGVQDVWASRAPLTSPEEPGVLLVGSERVTISSDDTGSLDDSVIDNRVVLSRYIAAVRRQRGLEPDDSIELRAVDLAALSTVLNLDDDSLQALLTELLDLTPAGAQWAVRSMLVGGLVALAATGMLGTSWFASPVSAAPVATPPAVAEAAPLTVSPDVSVPGTSIERDTTDVEVSDAALTVERTSPFSLGTAQVSSTSVSRDPGTSPFSVDDVNEAAVVVDPPVFRVATGYRPMDQLFAPDDVAATSATPPAALPPADA